MGERALKWGLRLIGIALTLGPILIALGARGWDVKAAVMPTESEIREMEEAVRGILGGELSENNITFESPVYSDGTARAAVHFTSPFKVSVILKEFSGKLYDGEIPIGDINMEEEEVEVPPGGTVTFHLVANFSGGPPSNPRPQPTSITFELYGLTMTIHPSGGEEGGKP